jgi:hypothetical protein
MRLHRKLPYNSNKMTRFLVIMLLFAGQGLNAQEKPGDFRRVDALALQIPDSQTRTTQGISGYITSNFTSQTDRSRAIFVWVATRIQYDIDNMFAVNFYESADEIIKEALSKRKGVCQHFAELFNAIANQSGIKTYVITGYTKQNGLVDYLPHAWCASLIDSVWYLVDPTWGSGYILDSRFIRKINDNYYKAKPEKMISSHMPFDPLWQFLNYPVTSQEFYEGRTAIDKSKPFFDYQDTLSRFEQESKIGKLEATSRRIEQNGVRNSLISDRLLHNRREIEFYYDSLRVEIYNSAVYNYNDGINHLNRFIDYRNRQFTPKKEESEIREMVNQAEWSLLNARLKLQEIQNPDSNTAASILQLNRSIEEAMLNLNEQRLFVDKYFRTGKMLRKSLFYKYTWMGIPLK